MLRKLPGLIWTLGLLAIVVKRFVPPETLRSIIDQVQGSATETPAPVPLAGSNGAEVHTPLPVA